VYLFILYRLQQTNFLAQHTAATRKKENYTEEFTERNTTVRWNILLYTHGIPIGLNIIQQYKSMTVHEIDLEFKEENRFTGIVQ
jgi:hypothetical protein